MKSLTLDLLIVLFRLPDCFINLLKATTENSISFFPRRQIGSDVEHARILETSKTRKNTNRG